MLAATTSSGTAWYSVNAGWDDLDSVEIEPLDNLTQVEVTVFYDADSQQSLTAPTNSERAQVILQNGATSLVGLMVERLKVRSPAGKLAIQVPIFNPLMPSVRYMAMP